MSMRSGIPRAVIEGDGGPMVTKERRQLLEAQIGYRLNMDDVKWEFRAVGAECSEPYRYDDTDEWTMLDIKTDSLEVTLHDDGSAMITETMAECLWANDVEWQVLKLVMRLIGVE